MGFPDVVPAGRLLEVPLPVRYQAGDALQQVIEFAADVLGVSRDRERRTAACRVRVALRGLLGQRLTWHGRHQLRGVGVPTFARAGLLIPVVSAERCR